MPDSPVGQHGASDKLIPHGTRHRVSEVTVIQETVAAVLVTPPPTTPAAERQTSFSVGAITLSEYPGQPMRVRTILWVSLGLLR